MNVALLTFTRDRLDYTKHCFATLEANAGCDYDHFVLDNASSDGTVDWLHGWKDDQYRNRQVCALDENIGICAGANKLLEILEPGRYDTIVRYDNDCEVTQPDTLKVCAELAQDYGVICSPHVLGLQQPPPSHRQAKVGDRLLDETTILGGIFMAIPSQLFWEHEFRYNEAHPLGAGDEAIVPWWRARGGTAGYVHGLTVNHYETTLGQQARYPDYFARKEAELVA